MLSIPVFGWAAQNHHRLCFLANERKADMKALSKCAAFVCLSFHTNIGGAFCGSAQFSSVQLLSCVQLFVTPWTAACQASLSITNSQSLLKFMSFESVMQSNHLILCRPLFLPPSIFSSIRVFCNELVLRIRWPKYWSFSFSISPSNEYSGLISFRMDWFDLLDGLISKGLSRIFSNTTFQKHQFYDAQPSL